MVAKTVRLYFKNFARNTVMRCHFMNCKSPVPPSNNLLAMTISDLTLAVESQATSKRQAEKMAAARAKTTEKRNGDYGSDRQTQLIDMVIVRLLAT